MIQFDCDYLEGAHPRILEKLLETNLEQTEGYGCDPYSEAARRKIRAYCALPDDAEVQFLVGGTQTNTTVIASILHPHQGVICADTGHINHHETGAIEATGHKVLPIPTPDGKLTAAMVEDCYYNHWNDATHEHMVQPGMVYISHPTENGTLYSKAELSALHTVCTRYGLPLYLDGARLGYGLMAPSADLTLPDIARYCDVFYIGGTKVGALFGEAVVIPNSSLSRDFRYIVKQRGGMLAKGRLLGLQFLTLFTDDLYFQVSTHALEMAYRIRDAFAAKGFPFLYESESNQQFPILPNHVLDQLSDQFSGEVWSKCDETHTAVRFCTSWATTAEQVASLEAALEQL